MCMYADWHSCLQAGRQSRTQACRSTRRSEGALAVQHYQEETKIFFEKKTEKGKKEKETI